MKILINTYLVHRNNFQLTQSNLFRETNLANWQNGVFSMEHSIHVALYITRMHLSNILDIANIDTSSHSSRLDKPRRDA